MNFYTYVYFDEIYIPYYVGEGSRRRYVREHRVPVPPVERILRIEQPSKEAALKHEHFLVTHIGRRDLRTGPLMNLTDGGAGAKNPCAIVRQIHRITGSNLGSIYGHRSVKSGRLHSISAKGGHAANHLPGGEVAGRLAVETGQLAEASHIRWHVKRGIVKAGCALCQ